MRPINYNVNNAYTMKTRNIQKKAEEEKTKQVKEQEKAEPQKSAVINEPAADGLKALAEQNRALQGLGNVSKSGIQAGPRSGGADVQALIERWYSLPDDTTNEVKSELLTQIIDIFENNNDINNARIWRVRRYTVSQNICNQERLDFLQRIKNGEHVNFNAIPMPNYDSGDLQAYCELQDKINAGSMYGTEEDFIFRESLVAVHTKQTLERLIHLKNPNSPYPADPRNAYIEATSLYGCVTYIANVPKNADQPWHNKFVNEFKPMFDEFHNIMSNALDSKSAVGLPEIHGMVSNLQELIEELRSQGCTYCDELLVSIHGHLVYRGIATIDVLPY